MTCSLAHASWFPDVVWVDNLVRNFAIRALPISSTVRVYAELDITTNGSDAFRLQQLFRNASATTSDIITHIWTLSNAAGRDLSKSLHKQHIETLVDIYHKFWASGYYTVSNCHVDAENSIDTTAGIYTSNRTFTIPKESCTVPYLTALLFKLNARQVSSFEKHKLDFCLAVVSKSTHIVCGPLALCNAGCSAHAQLITKTWQQATFKKAEQIPAFTGLLISYCNGVCKGGTCPFDNFDTCANESCSISLQCTDRNV